MRTSNAGKACPSPLSLIVDKRSLAVTADRRGKPSFRLQGQRNLSLKYPPVKHQSHQLRVIPDHRATTCSRSALLDGLTTSPRNFSTIRLPGLVSLARPMLLPHRCLYSNCILCQKHQSLLAIRRGHPGERTSLASFMYQSL